MHTEATKIILLVSAPQQHVRIGGVELPVVGLTRGGDVPPIVPVDARDIIVGCLDALIAHPVSLTEIFNRWAIARIRKAGGSGRPGGGRQATAWLPRAFRARRFGTDCLPPNREFEGEEEYDAGNAATALDQIVTDRQTADEYPIPTLGQWTNYAELATGLGWATVNQPSFNKAAGRLGDSLPVDNVERAAYLRRAFEEYKAAACCADEVLAPTAVENVGPFWSVLVTDNGDKTGDTVEEVGYDLLNSAPQEAGLSWVVNIFEFPGVGYTGKRTPAGLWLSEHCTGISTFKVSGLEEFTQMTGMGEWWGNDYFIQPMTRQDDAAQVERGLMRIDPLEVGERDFLYAICPDGRIAPDFCYRLDTSLFQTLAVERGWSGLLPAPTTLEGPPRPFGWGITVRNRDWSVPNLRIIALSPRVAQWLETTQTIPPIVYKTPVHAPVYKGSGAQAIYKKYGLGKTLGRRKGGNSAGENFSAGPGGQPSPEARAGDEAAPGEVTAVSAGVAARPSGNVGQAAGGLERSVDMQKPAPGGSGTDPAPKVATTPEAAERNADHRKAEDVA
ncbi:hypothetical protein ACJJTC_006468 [Scirpophaga incertulas]